MKMNKINNNNLINDSLLNKYYKIKYNNNIHNRIILYNKIMKLVKIKIRNKLN